MLVAVILAVGAVVFVNGWTDAPTAISSCVVSGVLSLRRAAILAAICNLLGIALSSAVRPAVTATVQGMVSLPTGASKLSLAVLLCAMAGTAVWAVVAWFFGIPTSESHALLAGLSGAAVSWGGWSAVRLDAWRRVALGLGLSLVGGAVLGFLIFAAAERVWRKGDAATEKGVGRMLVFGAATMAFMHGAQDGQKFMGMWLLALSFGGGTEISRGGMVAACALLMGMGTLIGGGRIVKTLGQNLVKTGLREGFSADLGAAVCLLLLTLAGFPVSTTHTKTAAIMGTGIAKGRGGWDTPTVIKLFLTWLLTFPICFLLSYWGMKRLLPLL